ncbi:alpha/beta fold hydrolase [Streptomyces albipurpureus]|uniref:alpha/beta fold hydrolase n=1 Tax=Streptomyces albipurpureus TaxID=2897419 RepID=UPI0027E54C63|nr:alpha/beta hydrolase [Streptomyces sp. CWNU-1]
MKLTYDLAGTGPTVLLLHSTVCDRRMWDPQWPTLTGAGLRVVRCDFRGYGDTPAADGPFTDAEDVLELLDGLGVQRAALVGSSYGGRVALELAARAPERITALALLCAGLPDQGTSPELIAYDEQETELFERGDLSGAAALNARTWLGPDAGPQAHALVAKMQLHAFEVQVAGAQEHGEHYGDHDFDPAALAAVRAPALVLSGAYDLPDFRTTAARLASLLPEASARELPWAGHLPGLERPAETTQLLLDFLTEHLLPTMTAHDVLDLWGLFERAGARVWLDGGWGVDALLGEETRPHGDLDIAVDSRDADRLRQALGEAGFQEIRDDGPFNPVFADAAGRLVDIHYVDFTATALDQHGTRIHGPGGLAYPVGSLTATGTVLGKVLPCVTAGFQVAAHAGYAIDANDARDVLALHHRFGVPLLPEQLVLLAGLG